jgi:hypothetical protein
MVSKPTGRPRGRQPGWTKPWRDDPDRHVIPLADEIVMAIATAQPNAVVIPPSLAASLRSANVGVVTLNVEPHETAIKLSFLFHQRKLIAPHERAFLKQRRLNLSAATKGKLSKGFRLDIYEETPPSAADSDPTPKGRGLKVQVKRIKRMMERLSGDEAFQHWRRCMRLAWRAVVRCSSAAPESEQQLIDHVSMLARQAGEEQYSKKVLVELLRRTMQETKTAAGL